MPHPLPSAIQAQIDIDNDRRARGIASPPIVDFTRFEDTYRGPRSGNYEGLIATRKAKAGDKYGGMRSSSIGVKPASKKTIHFEETSGPESDVAPHPAAQRKPDPRLVLAALKDILGSERETNEYLDGHELLALHQLDQLDFEERDVVMADFQRMGKLRIPGRRGGLGSFLLWFPLFVDNGFCSGFGNTDATSFNLLVDNDGPGWARTRTPDPDCELR